MMIAPGHIEMEKGRQTVSGILAEYREKVNPDLLFVTMDCKCVYIYFTS